MTLGKKTQSLLVEVRVRGVQLVSYCEAVEGGLSKIRNLSFAHVTSHTHPQLK